MSHKDHIRDKTDLLAIVLYRLKRITWVIKARFLHDSKTPTKLRS